MFSRLGRSLCSACALVVVAMLLCAGEAFARDAGDLPSLSDLGQIRVCLPPTDSSPTEVNDLAAAVAVIKQLGAFKAFLSELIESSGVTLCVDPGSIQCRGYFEPVPNIIAVATGLSRASKVLIVAHELRHLYQKQRGFGVALEYDEIGYVRQTYAYDADAQAFTTLYAWTARELGHPELWEALTGLEHYEDIAAAFAATMAAGAPLPEAMSAAFSAWFKSDWRRQRYYVSAAGNYLDQLDASHAIRKYTLLPETFFDALCMMPDGSKYECRVPETGPIRSIGIPSN